MSEYTQGICEDGAAILRDGERLTIEEILHGLQQGDELAELLTEARELLRQAYHRLGDNAERIAELEYNQSEYDRLHAELAKVLRHDAPAPSLCDLVGVAQMIVKERDELAAIIEAAQRLADEDREDHPIYGSSGTFCSPGWKSKFGRDLHRILNASRSDALARRDARVAAKTLRDFAESLRKSAKIQSENGEFDSATELEATASHADFEADRLSREAEGPTVFADNGDEIERRLAEDGAVGTDAWDAVFTERQRQVEQEGWTPEHDDQWADGELARAAACYAHDPRPFNIVPPKDWPWDEAWWKPSDRRRDLVKAGALILAELERIDRLEAEGGSQS